MNILLFHFCISMFLFIITYMYINYAYSVEKNVNKDWQRMNGRYKNELKKVYGLNEADYYLLKPHLKLGKINNHKPNASTMSFEQWKQVGIFGDREIVKILRIRKETGGYIGWKELVILFDLTEAQAEMLQATIQISE